MKSTLFSFGLPVVKSKYLRDSISSCLSQTHANFELIIVNNSADNLEKSIIKEIVDSFDDKRIRYFENENQVPMVKNWNLTLDKTEGQFFTLLCDDDVLDECFIEKQLASLLKYPKVSIIHCRLAHIDTAGNVISISPLCPSYESGYEFIYHRLSNHRVFFLSDFVVRTKDLKMIEGFVDFPDGWGSDTLTWFYLSLNGGVLYNSDVLFYYRNSEINTSNSGRLRNKLKAIDMQHTRLLEIFKELQNLTMDFKNVRLRMLEIQLLKFVRLNKIELNVVYFKNKLGLSYRLVRFVVILGFVFFEFTTKLKWANIRNRGGSLKITPF